MERIAASGLMHPAIKRVSGLVSAHQTVGVVSNQLG
jgi:hypothetical protein